MTKDISVSLRWNTAIRHTYKEQELFGKEEKMYTFDSRVRYSEIDHTGNMTLPALINYFQDCSTFQSEDIGLGTEVLKAKKKAWILSYWQIVIERLPALGERITAGTFATEFKGLYGNRNFVLDDARGNRLAYANSVWVFMDMEKEDRQDLSRKMYFHMDQSLRLRWSMKTERSVFRRIWRKNRRFR